MHINSMVHLHELPKKVSNDLEKVVLYIPTKDEHLSLKDKDKCSCMFSGFSS
jgi:hypothetical protein